MTSTITHTAPFRVDLPSDGITSPLVIDSPHSWSDFPHGFDTVAERKDLLTSWDAWVDELFASATDIGAPLLVAQFPRFYLDLNRSRDDIDPSLVDGDLGFQLRPTKKTEMGMGLLRRQALPGLPVYPGPLPAQEVLRRIAIYYDPYYAELKRLLGNAHARFGKVIHIDCHSMKSRGNAMNDDPGCARPDIVLSDRDETTAHPDLTKRLAKLFQEAGYTVQVNDPYKGGYLIERYADPEKGFHAIQIELNRALYMYEAEFSKREPGFGRLRMDIAKVMRSFSSEL
ncbi:N-formylglutamate amidohydrolase [Nitratireductor aquimarinus]|uniref:N-formylglutamate amidohydrolase n=1 Tax=Nitratireductor aquimarinus TaxID=889300 RepID=UPI001A8C7682|nr:N-formylglutamate amidohydrolase [Nitratireductor aquimarinus]MBN8245769.1 N-formylglutamate amidohydrolase [Nitratireductor aquimarinus]MBY6134149.1 N-formylglutamate amidohydrolase [Nitratireductor aquimarinus]MCA1305237.1 N-formylglutamate amidohydrolase [Nitratireductor aquimarinus]